MLADLFFLYYFTHLPIAAITSVAVRVKLQIILLTAPELAILLRFDPPNG